MASSIWRIRPRVTASDRASQEADGTRAAAQGPGGWFRSWRKSSGRPSLTSSPSSGSRESAGSYIEA